MPAYLCPWRPVGPGGVRSYRQSLERAHRQLLTGLVPTRARKWRIIREHHCEEVSCRGMLSNSLPLSLSCPHSKPSSPRCLFVRLRILDTRRRSRARPTRKCCQQCYTVGIHGNALVQPAQLDCGIAEPAMFCFRVLSVSYLQGQGRQNLYELRRCLRWFGSG